MQPSPDPGPAARAPQVTACADRLLAREEILETPYLAGLRDGSLSLEAFQASQTQFYFAVEFFSRPMAALVARIPSPRARLDILHNLVEEHGEFEEDGFHATTFQTFLTRIGVDVTHIDAVALWPEVRIFNSALTGLCVHDELEVGVACMGIIEHSFAGISACIAEAVVANGWTPADQLVHYKLHAEIDERHAEEFYRVVEPAWADPARRYFIEQGLETGIVLFKRLYEGFFERTR